MLAYQTTFAINPDRLSICIAAASDCTDRPLQTGHELRKFCEKRLSPLVLVASAVRHLESVRPSVLMISLMAVWAKMMLLLAWLGYVPVSC